MTKILFLAYYFPPAGGAGVQRSLKFVQYLPDEGYLPSVITGPTSPDDRWTPHDRTLMSSVPSIVEVHRVLRNPPSSGGKMRSRLERWFRKRPLFSEWWTRSLIELGAKVAADHKLIFATMSPFESGEAAQELSARLGMPWVADLRDPWALDEMQVYPSWLHRKLEMRRMERLLRTASLIVMNTPEATKALKHAFPSLAGKPIVTITNGFDADDFSSALEKREDVKFRIVHTGYFHTDNGMQLRKRSIYRLLGGAERGIDILTRSHMVLLKAVEELCAVRPDAKENIELVFAGKTSEEDRRIAQQAKVADLVYFPGYLTHEKSVSLIRTADLLFLPMPDMPPGRKSRIVPGKTYEYMAARRPILAAAPEGDARDFVSESGTGLICQPGDVQGMRTLIEDALTNWKLGKPPKSPNQTFINRFERRNLTRSLADALDSVLGSKMWSVSKGTH